jgi:YidC/Oxa1 family membrane protein insertase
LDIGSSWQIIVDAVAQGLVFLYNALNSVGIGNWGLTIILFTLIVKIVLLPLTVQQLRSARAMQSIQPAMRALQKQYGKDREKLAQEQMKLYKEYGVNPMGGCLPILIQFPIWIALYGALLTLADPNAAISQANNVVLGGFLWIPNLSAPDHLYILAVLSGITQWVMTRQTTPKTDDPQQKQMNQTMQFMPLMFVVFAINFSSGLVLYWVANAVISIALQYPFVGWGSLEGFNFFGLLNRGTAPAVPAGKSAKAVKAPKPAKELSAPGSNGKDEAVSENAGDVSGDANTGDQGQPTVTRKRRLRTPEEAPTR